MMMLRRLLLALLAIVAMDCGLLAPATLAQTAPTVSAQETAEPRTNAEIRQWYNDQVAVIPALDQQWRAQGLSAEERARRAYAIRHDARLKARAFMADPNEVADLQARDQAKYGNPDGPTFDQLVAQNQAKGLSGDAVFNAIVTSADQTNAGYNQQFNVRPQAQAP